MTFPYLQENTESRRRLETLVGELSEADFALSTDYGWTIPALLVHLAFWDQRMLAILQRWKENGFDPSPIDSQAVNGALHDLCHAMDPRTAIELCLSSAEAIDAELATLTPDYVKQIEEQCEVTSTQFRMNRALHRNGHLDDIEALLKN